jgi:hypothetical protein
MTENSAIHNSGTVAETSTAERKRVKLPSNAPKSSKTTNHKNASATNLKSARENERPHGNWNRRTQTREEMSFTERSTLTPKALYGTCARHDCKTRQPPEK